MANTNNPIVVDVGEILLADRTVGEDGQVTYETPKSVSTAASVKTAYTKGKTVVYESGVAVLNRPYVSMAEVTVQTSTMSLADRMSLFFNLQPKDNGEFEEGSDADRPAEKALGYWYKLSDGSYYCIWWFNASAQPADESGETSDDTGPKVTPQDIIFSCVTDPVLHLRRRVAIVKDEAARQAFFASVIKAAA